jgi:hypothetical protein
MKSTTRQPSLIWSGATAGFLTTILITAGLCAGQRTDDFEHEAIQYLKTPANDAITQLQTEINSGKVQLEYNAKNGYLSAVLKHLNIPVASQILVFSKTSFQREKISPNTPRALYFNERATIGWVQGGPVVEVVANDPQQGAMFYVLEQSKTGKPRFLRQNYECLQCHNSTMTAGVPGHIMRSVYPGPDGQPEFRAGTFLTTDNSPMEERWGGWYVTGKHGKMRRRCHTR